jgi:multidrug resistance efflux pump
MSQATPSPQVRTVPIGGTPVAQQSPKPSHKEAENSPVLALLRLEGEARGAKTLSDLAILIANESRKVTRARQIFVLRSGPSESWSVMAASGLAKIDPNVPLVQLIAQTVTRLKSDAGLGATREFILQSYADPTDDTAKLYPYRQALWFPLADKKGQVFAGVLLLREDAWTSGEQTLATRLSVSFAHAWYWIATNNKLSLGFKMKPLTVSIAVAALLGVALFPVSMTTLAPLEIAPRDPVIVTAPIDGVIEAIPVDANAAVKAGDSVVRLVDTNLRNRLAVSEREVQVADAKVKKALLLAVTDIRGRHELAISRAELTVKTAERDYARELLARANITTPKDGLALFGDRRDMIGKPVTVGEKIMEIADPKAIEIRVDVPVSDVIILAPGARVKVFLDSAPLTPLEAKIVRADYQAKTHESQSVAFRATAMLTDETAAVPRLGIRGTAELYGSKVPFIFYVFRRPISGLRQWIGT